MKKVAKSSPGLINHLGHLWPLWLLWLLPALAWGEASVLVRGTQAYLTVSGTDAEQALDYSSHGGVGSWGLELAWSLPPTRNSLSWGLSLELERSAPIVFDQHLHLFRRALRVESGSGKEVGVIFGLGTHESILFRVDGASQVQRVGLTRTEVEGGLIFRKPISGSVEWRGIGILRVDLGAASPSLPGPVSTSIGFDIASGPRVLLSKHAFLETRLRVEREAFGWNSGTGAATQAFSALNLCLDGALGLRF